MSMDWDLVANKPTVVFSKDFYDLIKYKGLFIEYDLWKDITTPGGINKDFNKKLLEAKKKLKTLLKSKYYDDTGLVLKNRVDLENLLTFLTKLEKVLKEENHEVSIEIG